MKKMERKTEAETKRNAVKFCRLCGKPFATAAKRRVFCKPQHRNVFYTFTHLKRKEAEGKLKEWEVRMLGNLEAYIKREREKVEAELEEERKKAKAEIETLLQTEK